MKSRHPLILTLAAMTAALLTSCSTTSVKTTWKAPDHKGGPVQKVALLAVEERGLVRGGFENRFVNQLTKQGQAAFATYEMLSLPDIKANKEGAAAALRQAGADSVLILRLMDTTTRFAEVRQSGEAYAPVTTGFGTDGWYNYYTVALTDMTTLRGSTRQNVILETSLFDLATGKRLWTCITDTLVKDGVDKLEVADAFVAKAVAALRKEGLVR